MIARICGVVTTGAGVDARSSFVFVLPVQTLRQAHRNEMMEWNMRYAFWA